MPPPTSAQHPDALLLLYAEGLLPADEERSVEEHVNQCAQCSSDVEWLRRITAALKDNKRAFCPEARDLWESALHGRAPEGVLKEHVSNCPWCSRELEAYQRQRDEVMPEALWQQVKERLPESAKRDPRPDSPETTSWGLQELVSRWFKIPALAAAAVAAVVLVFVFYPTDTTGPFIGMSSVSWENAPRPKAGPALSRERAAFLLVFNDPRKVFSQKEIDTLYQALAPSMELSERWQILTPAEVASALREQSSRPSYGQESILRLLRALKVDRVAVVTVTPSAAAFSVRGQLLDGRSGHTLKASKDEVVSQEGLADRIRDIADGLMG